MVTVQGLDVDPQSRCRHYHTPLDIVAIRMACCGEYFACRTCHDATADHAASTWPLDQHEQLAIRCGACTAEFAIAAYLHGDDSCPGCGARFNPRCRLHHAWYFAVDHRSAPGNLSEAPPRIHSVPTPEANRYDA